MAGLDRCRGRLGILWSWQALPFRAIDVARLGAVLAKWMRAGLQPAHHLSVSHISWNASPVTIRGVYGELLCDWFRGLNA